MILYKYMSYNALSACLHNNTLRFSSPHNFNDPFDCLASTPPLILHPHKNNIKEVYDIQRQLHALRGKVGVLSLTRNPLNLLMWAHYAQNHMGGVVAIDADLAGLGCENDNLIPYRRGNVLYTSVRPEISEQFQLLPKSKDDRHIDILQKLFLYKSIHWSYEEEVRVVKIFKTQEYLSHQDIKMPSSAIKAIYLGASSFKNLINDDGAIDSRKKHKFILSENTFDVMLCRLDETKWDLTFEKY